MFPPLNIRGINPFYLVETAYRLFEQKDLSPNEQFLPLYRFQETSLILAALYKFVKINAPSQAGKTTIAELLGAVFAYAYPGDNILILSTRQEQSERLLRDIRNKLVKCNTVPSLRKLSTDSSTTLEIAENRSRIIALPHSINALTGNPARIVILDELAKWDKDPASIYAEAVARTGATGGQVIAISSFFGEGVPDPKAPQGYRGNFFHYNWNQDFTKRHEPAKTAVAARFTYHVSPTLASNITYLKSEMDRLGKGYFNEHYLGIPRKSAGRAIFESDFNRSVHVKPDSEITLNPDEPLFLCYDPGLTKAAVLGQLDLEAQKLIYLRSFLGTRESTFAEFVKQVQTRCRQHFPAYELLYFADVAARKQNDQTNQANTEIIAQVTGQWPITQYQPIEPGIQAMRGFMRRHGAFEISDQAAYLIDAIESGLVHEERSGILQEKWAKDGHYEHVGDAARYPVYYLMGGMSIDALSQGGNGAYTTGAESYHTNPYTGY